MLEFYAGRGNLTRFMRMSGYKTASLDLKYGSKTGRDGKPRKSNPYDVLSPSGFAILAMHNMKDFSVYFCFGIHGGNPENT